MGFISSQQTDGIRKQLKEEYPLVDGWKFSVRRVRSMELSVSIMKAPVKFGKDDHFYVDHHSPTRHENHRILSRIIRICYDPNYYFRLEVGRSDKPFELTSSDEGREEVYEVSEIDVGYKAGYKLSERPQFTQSLAVNNFAHGIWNHEEIAFREEMKAVYLDRGNRVLGVRTISKGGSAGTVSDVKHILGIGMKANASGVILLHNHPSGSTKPSKADKKITDKVSFAGDLCDILLLDHLIITPEGDFYSFADEGNIQKDPSVFSSKIA